jgi:hypothetical protein
VRYLIPGKVSSKNEARANYQSLAEIVENEIEAERVNVAGLQAPRHILDEMKVLGNQASAITAMEIFMPWG